MSAQAHDRTVPARADARAPSGAQRRRRLARVDVALGAALALLALTLGPGLGVVGILALALLALCALPATVRAARGLAERARRRRSLSRWP